MKFLLHSVCLLPQTRTPFNAPDQTLFTPCMYFLTFFTFKNYLGPLNLKITHFFKVIIYFLGSKLRNYIKVLIHSRLMFILFRFPVFSAPYFITIKCTNIYYKRFKNFCHFTLLTYTQRQRKFKSYIHCSFLSTAVSVKWVVKWQK